MALTKPRRPLVLITGEVIAKEPKEKYDENGRRTGEVDRYDITLLQPSMSTPDVRFPLGPDAARVPEVGEHVAIIADCGETREYGANFRAVRHVTDDDLEGIAQKLPSVAAKG